MLTLYLTAAHLVQKMLQGRAEAEQKLFQVCSNNASIFTAKLQLCTAIWQPKFTILQAKRLQKSAMLNAEQLRLTLEATAKVRRT